MFKVQSSKLKVCVLCVLLRQNPCFDNQNSKIKNAQPFVLSVASCKKIPVHLWLNRNSDGEIPRQTPC